MEHSVKSELIKREKKYSEQIYKKIEEFNSNGKKTIAYFCDSFYPSMDGVISVLHNIACQMSKCFNVVVCVPKYKGETTIKSEYLVIGAKSLYLSKLKVGYSPYPEQDRKFTSYLKKLKIDIIHFHSPFAMGKFAAKLGKSRKIPVFATFHSQYEIDFKMITKSAVLTKFLLLNVVKIFNMADAVFTMYEFSKKIAEKYGIKVPIYLIPNGTNMRKLDDLEAIKEIERKYNLKQSVPMLVSVGRLVRVKNLELMIEALGILKERDFNFIAIIVGTGSLLKSLKQKAEKLGVGQNIIFTGYVAKLNDLLALYARADLFLLPSMYETCSLSRIEASVQGTALLAINETVSASIIKDGENGYICENNAESFADKIIEIFSDRNKLKKVSEKAQKEFSVFWEDVALTYKSYYLENMKK